MTKKTFRDFFYLSIGAATGIAAFYAFSLGQWFMMILLMVIIIMQVVYLKGLTK